VYLLLLTYNTNYIGQFEIFVNVSLLAHRCLSIDFRFYEFNTSAITCLKFSIKTPNNLAIGFDSGKILIIDISKKSLNIVFQTSSKLSLETTSISELFWTTNTENKIPHEVKSECLVSIKCLHNSIRL